MTVQKQRISHSYLQRKNNCLIRKVYTYGKYDLQRGIIKTLALLQKQNNIQSKAM